MADEHRVLKNQEVEDHDLSDTQSLSVIYSDDAVAFMSSLSPDEQAMLEDCNQMRNYGRPGYEHEWAPTEHASSFAEDGKEIFAGQEIPSSLQLAESAVFGNGVKLLWNERSQLMSAVGIVVAFICMLLLRRRSNRLEEEKFHLEHDDNDADDFYQPLL